MKNKGFTLVELLAVIVILAVISLIAYAVIQKNIDVTRKSSFETSVKNMIEAAKEYVVTNYEENDFPEGGIDITNNELDIKNSEFISGIIMKNEVGSIEVVNLTDGNLCANGTKNDLEITSGSCEASDKTAPTLEVKVLKRTSNKVRFLVKMQDAQSGLKELKYSYGDNEKTIELPNKRGMHKQVIEVTNLEAGKKYNFKFTVVNNVDTDNEKITTTVKEKEVELPVVEEPMFKISSGTYATTKVLTIIYPEVEGYEFSYQKGEEIETQLETGKYETSFDILENTLVKAIIKKDGQEVISSKLMVTGLDVEPPIAKVFIENRDEWTLEKKVYVKATDEGAGLALRGYSLNKKKSWIRNGEENLLTVLRENQVFTLKTRDKVGNIQEKFYLCEDRNFENCRLVDDASGESSIIIDKIDNVGPKMEMRVIEGELGANNWYTSNKVVVELVVRDIAWRVDEEGNKIEMDGCGIKKVTLKMNNQNVDLSNPYSGSLANNYVVYHITLTTNGIYKFIYDSEDNLGNKTDGDFEVKKDDVRPSMSATTQFTGGGRATTSLVGTRCGISGVTTVCNPSSVGAYTRTNVTCTGTCGNGLSTTNSYSIGFYYSATPHGHTEHHESCHESCEWHSNGCCDNVTHPGTTGSYSCHQSCTTYSNWVLDYYTCDHGGSLNGSTCYF